MENNLTVTSEFKRLKMKDFDSKILDVDNTQSNAESYLHPPKIYREVNYLNIN